MENQSDAKKSDAAYPLRAVDRVCDILDALADEREVSLHDVATAAALPKSSAFRYLAALERRHYVEKTVGGEYRLGVAFRPQQRRQQDLLVELALPILERLAAELEETVNLGLLDGSQIVHAAVVESPHAMRLAARVGDRGFVHSTALGKALTATMDAERVGAILDVSGMPRFTEHTLTTREEFFAELERTKTHGYGVDEAENQLAGRCVAVQIPRLDFLAGVSVSAPADRLHRTDIAPVAERLHTAAREIADAVVPASN